MLLCTCSPAAAAGGGGDDEEKAATTDKRRNVVDVRDVAAALILTYENPAASGRYICSAYDIKVSEMVDIVRRFFPDINYPK